MYSTQHTHSLSTAFHTLLNILIAWVPLSILDSKYSKLEYRFPYSTRVWVRYRANTQRWVEYRVWLSILDSKYSKLEYNFPYSTQNTQSLSTTSHTRLNILIAWVQLSILYSSMSTVSGKYSTMSRVSSMTFHTRLKILKAWVWLSILDSKYSILYSSLSTCLRLRDVILRGILYPDIVYSSFFGLATNTLNVKNNNIFSFLFFSFLFFSFLFWCPCMAINVSVQYNGGLLPDITGWKWWCSWRRTTAPFRRTRTSPRSHRRTSAITSPRGSTDRTRIFWTQRRRLTRWSTTRLPLPVA